MKPEFHVELRKIRTEEYQRLRSTTNWRQIPEIIVTKALEKDLFSVCILKKEKIVGMGRVIGDGSIYFYIQDVIVLPEFQMLGIGKLIMDQIENYLNNNAPNGAFIGLMAAEGTVAFYQSFGYRNRPESRPGMYKIFSNSSLGP